MDIEVIQEFSENQCYLNALSSLNMQKELELKIDMPKDTEVEQYRKTETLEKVMKEPLGKLLLRTFLRETNALDHLLFIDTVDEYESNPDAQFRKRLARKILQHHFTEGCKQEIAIPSSVVDSIKLRLEREGAVLDLFEQAKQAVNLNLSLSSFQSFLYHRYYNRLVGFRLAEQHPVSQKSFTFIRILGEGGFGKVFAVSKNDTHALYACKTMLKEKVIARKRENLILNERNILTQVYHPFIVTLQYAFQDGIYLYLVQDLMSGGELGFHLQRLTKFSERMVRFYAAGIVLAIEFLHSKGIVYRDLKPENIMLDADGYIRLTDLGLCTHINPNEKLFQHCGTRSFMAPEQCMGDTGYDFAVDWWSLGVTFYNLLTGKNPFSRKFRQKNKKDVKDEREEVQSPISDGKMIRVKSKSLGGAAINDHKDEQEEDKKDNPDDRFERSSQLEDLYKEVIAEMAYPESMSEDAKSLCQQLMTFDPAKRLGAKGADEIKAHPFFLGVNWEKLKARHISPPFVPDREYVNAKFVEATSSALQQSKIAETTNRFEGFDFTRPMVYQEEIMQTLHSKDSILGH